MILHLQVKVKVKLWVGRVRGAERHGCILCCELCCGPCTLSSSAPPPPRLGRNGLLLWWGRASQSLHSQVWEYCFQSHCGGIKRVRFPTWGLLHADWLNALVSPLWRHGSQAEPQSEPPHRLSQERGAHVVAESVHVLRHPAPQFCQPHPSPW